MFIIQQWSGLVFPPLKKTWTCISWTDDYLCMENKNLFIMYLEVGKYGSDILLEAHINHPISLIQYKIAADIQCHDPFVQHIHEATRSSNRNVNTPANITRQIMLCLTLGKRREDLLYCGIPGEPLRNALSSKGIISKNKVSYFKNSKTVNELNSVWKTIWLKHTLS